MQDLQLNMDVFKNDFLTTLCDSVKEGAAIIEDASQKVIFCNDALLQMFEIDSSDVMDMAHLNKFRKTALSDSEMRKRILVTKKKGVFTEQVEYISRAGHSFWGEFTVRSFTNKGGIYHLLVIDQADKMKEGEKQRTWDKQRSNVLLETASMGIIETNHLAEIINVNPFALKLFGYEKDELLYKKIELLIPSRFHSRHVKNREDYIKHSRNRPMGVGMDLYAVKKNGTEFPVEVSLSSYDHNGDRHIIAFISDISIRKEAELEIQKLNNELEHTVEVRTGELTTAVEQLEISKEELSKSLEKEKELNDLKSKFVSMASHEFRTPLSTVLSSAYLLQKYTTTEEQPKRDKHLQRIISSVSMLTDILNDFLSVGKIEEGKIQVRCTEFDIRKFISSVIEEIKNNFHKRQLIRYHHKGDTQVWLDSSLMKHIILNLVSNASKFSPEDSSIEVKSETIGNELILSIRDQGIGISAEDQKHLMERFFRGANATNVQGTGLGLHIVAKYTELLNGRLECHSQLEKGTEFKITFKKDHHEEDSPH